EIAVEILHLRFAAARGAELVQQDNCSDCGRLNRRARSTHFERRSIINKSWCPPLQTHRFVMVSGQGCMLAFSAWIAVGSAPSQPPAHIDAPPVSSPDPDAIGGRLHGARGARAG